MLKYAFALDKVKMTLYSHTIQRRDLNGDFQAKYLERLLETHVLCKDGMSAGINTYRYQYTFREIGTDEGVIWLGIWSNQPKAIGEQNRMIQLEWNPQKTKIPSVMKEWLFFEKAEYTEINKCDLAFDFENIHPHDVRYFTKADTLPRSTRYKILSEHVSMMEKVWLHTKKKKAPISPEEEEATKE